MRKFLVFSFALITFFVFFSKPVRAAENIDPDNLGNDFAVLEYDSSQITFDCTNCNVEVTSAEVTGYAWGENTGWINLQPGSSGILNDGSGVLSGYAWGENTGWINFDPTFGGVSIVNGEFDGYAWSQNYGWIQFDCGVVGACVETSWSPTVTPPDDGGSGSSPVDQNEGCTNSSAVNYDPQATVDDNSCLYTVISGCTVPEATNYNENAVIDDNSCQFGDVEIPDTPTDPVPPDDTSDPGPTEDTDPNTPTDPVNPPDTDPGPGVGDGSSVLTILGAGVESFSLGINGLLNNIGDLTIIQSALPFFLLVVSLLALPLQQLLEAPLRAFQLVVSWFSFGKKKTWGIVFDSITKQPLDPVVVALKDSSGAVVQTSITDMEGRYGFVAAPGWYTIDAHKADYRFPSTELMGKNTDGIYDELYFGVPFEVTNQGDVISKNIPLDAVAFNWNEYEKARLGLVVTKTGFKKKAHMFGVIVFALGFAFSIAAIFISPTVWNYIVLALYIIMFILRLLGFPRHSGAVVRNGTYPLSFGVMRVYSTALHREVKKVVLDNLGNYYCLIKNGEYYVTFESRNQDGTYTLIHTSESFIVRNGIIQKKFLI